MCFYTLVYINLKRKKIHMQEKCSKYSNLNIMPLKLQGLMVLMSF